MIFMTGSKNIIEPTIIILIFTTFTLINRARNRVISRWQPARETPDLREPLLQQASPPQEPACHEIQHWLSFPDTFQFHSYPISRLLRRYSFLIEIWYWLLTYWPYQLLRAATALYINHNDGRRHSVEKLAEKNAIKLLQLEKWLKVDVEKGVQQSVLTRFPGLMDWLCDVYLAHITVGVLFLGYAFTVLPRSRYQYIRRTIALNNILAFIVLSAYRCTPPRLMPSPYGYNDVLHPSEPSSPSWSNNKFQLTLAAMPSLHFGTSLLLGLSTAIWGKYLIVRILAPFYPLVMLLTVLATANHWVLDCFAGVAVVLLGLCFNWVLLALRPIEEWAFWICGTEKPLDPVESSRSDDEYSPVWR